MFLLFQGSIFRFHVCFQGCIFSGLFFMFQLIHQAMGFYVSPPWVGPFLKRLYTGVISMTPAQTNGTMAFPAAFIPQNHPNKNCHTFDPIPASMGNFMIPKLHGWSTYPPLTYPPQKYGLNKALLRETNG